MLIQSKVSSHVDVINRVITSIPTCLLPSRMVAALLSALSSVVTDCSPALSVDRRPQTIIGIGSVVASCFLYIFSTYFVFYFILVQPFFCTVILTGIPATHVE